jgi:hypothetical protein
MIEYRFRVPSATVFTLYSYYKALEYRFRVSTAASLIHHTIYDAKRNRRLLLSMRGSNEIYTQPPLSLNFVITVSILNLFLRLLVLFYRIIKVTTPTLIHGFII